MRKGISEQTLYARFTKKFLMDTKTGCWNWTASTINSGYGVIGTGPHKVETAHRVSWRIYRGPIPNDLWVLHKCDNRRCVNPDHLYLGTIRDNAQDVMRRGKPYCFHLRSHITPEVDARRKAALPRGAAHHRSGAVLSAEEVCAIRAAHGSQRAIASQFGITQQNVSKIRRGETWGHLNG